MRARRLRLTARSRYGAGKALVALGAGLGFLVPGSSRDPPHPEGVGAGLVLLPRRRVAGVCGSLRAWPAWRPPSGLPPGAIRCWGRRLLGGWCGLGALPPLQPVPGWLAPWVGVARRKATQHPRNRPCWERRGCSPCFWYGLLPGARLGAEAAPRPQEPGSVGRARRGGFTEATEDHEAGKEDGVIDRGRVGSLAALGCRKTRLGGQRPTARAENKPLQTGWAARVCGGPWSPARAHGALTGAKPSVCQPAGVGCGPCPPVCWAQTLPLRQPSAWCCGGLWHGGGVVGGG
jgi:hypothetical protein